MVTDEYCFYFKCDDCVSSREILQKKNSQLAEMENLSINNEKIQKRLIERDVLE